MQKTKILNLIVFLVTAKQKSEFIFKHGVVVAGKWSQHVLDQHF